VAKKGLLGTGLGPDIGLGLGTLLQELGGGVTGLLRLLAPGSKEGEPGWAELGKGLTTSALGTASTPGILQYALPEDKRPSEFIKKIPTDLFGEDYRAQDLGERIAERGLLPALVEDIGNVALVAGGASAGLKAGSGTARAVGATKTATKLGDAAATANVAAHPYRPLGTAIRETALKPAQASVISAIEEGSSVGRGTQLLAGAENLLQGRDARKLALDQTRIADQERMIAARSPAVREAVTVARDHLITEGAKAGVKVTRREASHMVGDEIWARSTGVKALEQKFPEIPAEEFTRLGLRDRMIPAELKTPELEVALARATEAHALEKAKVNEILLSSRKGAEGLQAEDAPATLTKRQESLLRDAAKKFQRADSPVLQRKITRERASREAFLADQEAKLLRIADREAALSAGNEAATEAFGRSRNLGGMGPAAPVAYGTRQTPPHWMPFQAAFDDAPPRTMAQIGATPPKLPQPPAKSGDFYAAGRKGQEAISRIELAAVKLKQLETSRAQVQKAISEVQSVLEGHRLPSEVEQSALRAQGSKLAEKVAREQQAPSLSRTPARWQPLMHAVQKLGEEAESNPALASVLEGLPKTLEGIQDLALSYGFDAQHVRDFTPQQVRRLVFGNMRLGLGRETLTHEVAAGTRKARNLSLAKAGGVDRSIEAFLAASVEATVEARTNAVVSWVEKTVARKIPKDAEIPAGWRLWDPARTYLMTGTDLSEDALKSITVTATDGLIVPEAVIHTLDRFSRNYDHWAWKAISKVTSPWRTLVLTLSPGWYTRNFAGNVMVTMAEGVSLKDWSAAWKSYRTKDELGRFADVPFVRSGGLAKEAGVMADDSLIPRAGLREAISEEGKVRGTLQEGSRHLLRINEVVDEMARAAVYHRGINKLSLSPHEAWKRASEALVDYQALSPFERAAVRSVLPFYAWQKGILKVTLNQGIDHPARTGLILQLGQLNDEYIADRFGVLEGSVPDYYKHLIGDKNVRGYNPFADPGELLSPEGLTRSLNPFIELAVRKGLGAPENFPESYRVGFFGQPQPDVDVPSGLAEMVTRSPGGRILGNEQGEDAGGRTFRAIGLADVNDTRIRERLRKTSKQIAKKERETLLPPSAQKLL
jgi:hypothetical protein